MFVNLLSRIRHRKSASIRNQFTVYIVVSLLILISLTTYMTIVTLRTATNIHTEYAETTSYDFCTEVTMLTNQLDSLFSFLQYNEAVQSMMCVDSYRSIDGDLVADVDMAVITTSQLNNAVSDISLYNGTVAYSTIYGKEELASMSELLPDNSNVVCLGIKEPFSYRVGDKRYLTFGRRMYVDYREIAAMFISVDLDFLFRKLPSTPDRAFLLRDDAGTVCATKMSVELAEVAEKIQSQQLEREGEQISDFRGYMIYRQPLPAVNGTLISIIDTDLHQGEDPVRIGSSWIFVLLFMVFMAGSVLVFYHDYVTPINQLNRTITCISEKHLRQLEEPLELGGCSELRAIGDNFTRMLLSLDEMNEKVMETSEQLYEMEIAKKSAEIAYLRTQINPHFLYNTLELIRASAENGDNKVAVLAAVGVGKILRYSVKGGATAPLKEEIEVTKAYVNIQQARRKIPVTTIYSIPASVQQIPIMKMLLQPMVENAFLHGLDAREEDAVLFISASRSGDMLCISVRDNGSGIEPERLRVLRAQLHSNNPDTSSHLGLCNTHARIRLQYGPPYGIELDSTPDDGTRITLTLPTDREI